MDDRARHNVIEGCPLWRKSQVPLSAPLIPFYPHTFSPDRHATNYSE